MEYHLSAFQTYATTKLKMQRHGPTPELMLQAAYALLDMGELERARKHAMRAMSYSVRHFVVDEAEYVLKLADELEAQVPQYVPVP